jgi:hypothetical protein
MGFDSEATGDGSTATGILTVASGGSSTAMGNDTEASGDLSTAMGFKSVASGLNSTAMGSESVANGNYSNAIGNNNIASGYAALAMGSFSQSIGQNSVTIGGSNKALGNFSTAFGNTTIAEDLGSTSIGYWNSLDETPNPYNFSLQNTAFVIGNGGFDGEGGYIGTDESRSNALEVLFDGTTTIAGDLNINSDARLKTNIISLGSTLAKLLQIDGKSYIMKKDENKKQKIGVLAQDIEKVFPELVSESNGIKSVNYQGLVPVLINALKEQDGKMKEQQSEIEILKQQEKRLERLEKLVAQLD